MNVLQAITPQYYHIVPNELSRATVSPEREAIFQCLARVGSDRFVEFITDVLVQVEGHRLIDRTDGPGDEKQDILTIDRANQRHLTQCKHTRDFSSNVSGDDLDLLLGACFRKNCRTALYVTNADLTVQAKRYITDGEYIRGWQGPKNLLPTIDYWNGTRIWERISRSSLILNKWFSGMAQVHGLRSFFLDLVFRKMPSGEDSTLKAEHFAATLKGRIGAEIRQGDASFDVVIDDGLSLNISDWFRGSDDLGLPHLVPGENGYLNLPLAAVRVHVSLSQRVAVYDPALYRDRLARLFGDCLPDLPDGHWWHVVATPPQAFSFLHDTANAVLITVGQAEAYVRVGRNALMNERRWAVEPGETFERLSNPEDADDRAWKESRTGLTLRVITEQPVNPVAALDFHFRQKQIMAQLRTHRFRAIENADAVVVDTVRRLSDPRWFVLQSSSGDLFWAFPSDATQEDVARIENALARRDIQVFYVGDEDRDRIISQIDATPPLGTTILSGSDNDLSTPIDLRSRVFWFSREIKLKRAPTFDHLRALVELKLEYEARYGYDFLGRKDQMIIASEELRRFLFDVFSFRGRRMMDVGLMKNKVSIHWRTRESVIGSASQLAAQYAEECVQLEQEVLKRLGAESHESPSSR